ncbi:hypothetical protein [Blautia sp. MSJ-19]|uniref:hypothetical protein n=1 Tax=Blautia sp. MSJ-19 TaxID=2841517 RepID=UPI001C0EF424|nr:hypothetical protein [Blautia sp. MSJ-19]MBU5482327.1 hypothetical protein [Blautia sp. MSJ-19]
MAGVTLKELGLQFVKVCMETYWGSCWYPLLFLIGVLCTLIWGRKKNAMVFIGYTAFLALTVYNPIVVKYILSRVKFETEYYRFFWILPVIPAVAYYAVRLVSAPGKKWLKFFMALLVTAALVVLGNPLQGVITDFARAENIYKIPNDLRAVCDVIHQNQEGTLPHVVFESSLNNVVRQYDAGIRPVINRNVSIYRAGSTVAGKFKEDSNYYKIQKALLDVIDYHMYEEPDKFRRALRSTTTEFVVTSTDAGNYEFLVNAGCVLIAQTESHYVYRVELGE